MNGVGILYMMLCKEFGGDIQYICQQEGQNTERKRNAVKVVVVMEQQMLLEEQFASMRV